MQEQLLILPVVISRYGSTWRSWQNISISDPSLHVDSQQWHVKLKINIFLYRTKLFRMKLSKQLPFILKPKGSQGFLSTDQTSGTKMYRAKSFVSTPKLWTMLMFYTCWTLPQQLFSACPCYTVHNLNLSNTHCYIYFHRFNI